MRRKRYKAPLVDPLYCKGCKKEIERSRFSSYLVAGKRYWHTRCVRCRSQKYLRSATCRDKRLLVEGLKSVPCAKCGGTFPTPAMRFECVRGAPSFNIKASWSGRRKECIVEEAKKYDIVCANCQSVIQFAKREKVKPLHSKLAELPRELQALTELIVPATPSSSAS